MARNVMALKNCRVYNKKKGKGVPPEAYQRLLPFEFGAWSTISNDAVIGIIPRVSDRELGGNVCPQLTAYWNAKIRALWWRVWVTHMNNQQRKRAKRRRREKRVWLKVLTFVLFMRLVTASLQFQRQCVYVAKSAPTFTPKL